MRATGGIDRTPGSCCVLQADVNVIAWNALTPHTLASGGDEGRLRVWDLRSFAQPVADFDHHKCGFTVSAIKQHPDDFALGRNGPMWTCCRYGTSTLGPHPVGSAQAQLIRKEGALPFPVLTAGCYAGVR